MPTSPPPAAPKRILLIRLSAFGDVVIATGLLQGLKRAYPDAEIDWLVQPEFAGLLRTQPAIAQVQVWERKRWGQRFRSLHWLALLQEVLGFRRQLKARDYDWVIDAQGLAKSRLLAWLAGGRQRLGYRSKEPLEGVLHTVVTRHPEASPDRRVIGDEHLPMAAALGAAPLHGPQLLAVETSPPPAALVLLAPFTTRPQKHWPEGHWRQLINELLALGLPLGLLGGPADRAAAESLLAGLPEGTVTNLVGQTSFIAAGSWIAQCQALVGVDTGLTHMAVALGRPTGALFGSTLPYRQAPAAAVAPLKVIWLGLACSPCGRKPTCGGRWDCLQMISPRAVSASLRELLARP